MISCDDGKRIFDLLDSRNILEEDVIWASEVGSTIHGVGTGDDDLDVTVVRIETWHEFVNGPSKKQSMFVRTKPEGVSSEPGDIDIQVYTLRKFVHLVASGNPSILVSIHSPVVFIKRNVRLMHNLDHLCRSKRAGAAFLGYMIQQMKRWESGRGRKVNRVDLVDEHGYDTKYAYHTIRLGYQGFDYMKTGEIEIPMNNDRVSFLKAVRAGEVSEDDAMRKAKEARGDLLLAINRSPLPDSPNMDKVLLCVSNWYSSWFC